MIIFSHPAFNSLDLIHLVSLEKLILIYKNEDDSFQILYWNQYFIDSFFALFASGEGGGLTYLRYLKQFVNQIKYTCCTNINRLSQRSAVRPTNQNVFYLLQLYLKWMRLNPIGVKHFGMCQSSGWFWNNDCIPYSICEYRSVLKEEVPPSASEWGNPPPLPIKQNCWEWRLKQFLPLPQQGGGFGNHEYAPACTITYNVNRYKIPSELFLFMSTLPESVFLDERFWVGVYNFVTVWSIFNNITHSNCHT